MNKNLLLLAAFALCLACHPEDKPDSGNDNPQTPEEESLEIAYAKGADISWITEMESENYKFYNASGTIKECTALMKDLGCNAVRYRVWVNPTDGWCNKTDVLEKAKRAQALGLGIMIDFHYSDSWADPGQQTIPTAWKSYSVAQMTSAISAHTTDVLELLKQNGVENVLWVQAGNETDTGMLWDIGKVSNENKGANFITFTNAAYDAVKKVYPDAKVIIHHSGAQSLGGNQWFYDILKAGAAKYDYIGLSLYPSYWDSSISGYPDWKSPTSDAVNNFKTLNQRYSKPVMLVEFGMPASEPAKAKAALQYILDNTRNSSWFKGIFLWEPESENSRNGYDYGAFANGKPTSAMDPFRN